MLYSSKDYSSEVEGYHPDNKRFLSVDNTKFGVNIVVYALDPLSDPHSDRRPCLALRRSKARCARRRSR